MRNPQLVGTMSELRMPTVTYFGMEASCLGKATAPPGKSILSFMVNCGGTTSTSPGTLTPPSGLLTVSINRTFVVETGGKPDIVVTAVVQGSSYQQLPATTEVGLIILVVALIGTGVGLIWWRKRRKAVAVA